MAIVEPERFPCQAALLLAGEKNSVRVPQHGVAAPWPIKPLLQMLQWISTPEPRIEHPMGEHKIRDIELPQRTPSAERVVIPNSIDDDAIVVRRVSLQPRDKTGRI